MYMYIRVILGFTLRSLIKAQGFLIRFLHLTDSGSLSWTFLEVSGFRRLRLLAFCWPGFRVQGFGRSF